MRAMVLKAPNTPFVLEHYPDPTPGPGEAVARVLSCGSGLTIQHVRAGRIPVDYPRIVGHEITAKIVDVGSDVSDLSLDDPDQTTSLITHRITLLAWVRALTYNRMRDLLDHLPDPASSWTLLTAARRLIRRTGLLQIQHDCLWVIFDPFPGDEILTPYCNWVNAADFTIPWLTNLKLRLTIADQPIGASLPNPEVRKLLFSP